MTNIANLQTSLSFNFIQNLLIVNFNLVVRQIEAYLKFYIPSKNIFLNDANNNKDLKFKIK